MRFVASLLTAIAEARLFVVFYQKGGGHAEIAIRNTNARSCGYARRDAEGNRSCRTWGNGRAMRGVYCQCKFRRRSMAGCWPQLCRWAGCTGCQPWDRYVKVVFLIRYPPDV